MKNDFELQQSFYTRAVSKSIVVTAAVILSLLYFADHKAANSYLNQNKKTIEALHAQLTTGLPAAWFSGESLQASQAKQKKMFWMFEEELTPERGIAIEGLKNPALFSELFPGYSKEIAANEALWKTYFRRDFDTYQRLPSLVSRSQPVDIDWRYVSASSTGCFDVFQEYGADVLVFGTSEVFKDIIPKQLSDEVLINKTPSKVLMCTRHGTQGLVYMTQKSAEALALSKQKSKLAVWGYSFWGAYKTNAGRPPETDFTLHAYENWKQSNYLNPLYLKPSQFFQSLNWNSLVPFNIQAARMSAAQALERDAAESSMKESVEKNIGDRGYALLNKERAILSLNAYGNEALLEKAVNELQKKEVHSRMQGITEKDCDMTNASRELDDALSALLKVTEHVYLYLAPTSPYYTEYGMPKCFMPAVKKMLLSKQSEHVSVKTEDWKDYGFHWTEALVPVGEQSEYLTFDWNHLNYKGAEKFTKVIGDWIKQ